MGLSRPVALAARARVLGRPDSTMGPGEPRMGRSSHCAHADPGEMIGVPPLGTTPLDHHAANTGSSAVRAGARPRGERGNLAGLDLLLPVVFDRAARRVVRPLGA